MTTNEAIKLLEQQGQLLEAMMNRLKQPLSEADKFTLETVGNQIYRVRRFLAHSDVKPNELALGIKAELKLDKEVWCRE